MGLSCNREANKVTAGGAAEPHCCICPRAASADVPQQQWGRAAPPHIILCQKVSCVVANLEQKISTVSNLGNIDL